MIFIVNANSSFESSVYGVISLGKVDDQILLKKRMWLPTLFVTRLQKFCMELINHPRQASGKRFRACWISMRRAAALKSFIGIWLTYLFWTFQMFSNGVESRLLVINCTFRMLFYPRNARVTCTRRAKAFSCRATWRQRRSKSQDNEGSRTRAM